MRLKRMLPVTTPIKHKHSRIILTLANIRSKRTTLRRIEIRLAVQRTTTIRLAPIAGNQLAQLAARVDVVDFQVQLQVTLVSRYSMQMPRTPSQFSGHSFRQRVESENGNNVTD